MNIMDDDPTPLANHIARLHGPGIGPLMDGPLFLTSVL